MAVLSTSASIATPGLPVGSIQAFAGANAPTGWLLCDGSAVRRGDYPDLFNVLSTTYGSGDGSTTFNLPDLRGRMPIGAGNDGTSENNATRTRGIKGGDTRMPQHSHQVRVNSFAGDRQIACGPLGADGDKYSFSDSGNDASTNTALLYAANSGTGTGDNMPPFLVTNYIIKAVADIARGGWYTQTSPPAVTQLPTNPSVGEEVLYLTASSGGSLINLRWDGTQWNSLSGGLVLIQTKTFSGASSVSFDSVFSTLFKSYRIVGRELFGTGTNGLFWRLRVSASDNSASSYLYTGTYITHGGATGTITANPGNYAVGPWMTTVGDGRMASFGLDLNNPQTATRTSWTGLNSNYDALLTQAGQFTATNQFDGITFYQSGGNVTGTISIYGYSDR